MKVKVAGHSLWSHDRDPRDDLGMSWLTLNDKTVPLLFCNTMLFFFNCSESGVFVQ